MAHNENVGADRADTALMAVFDMNPITLGGDVSWRVIQLDFYARSYSIRARQVGGGPPPILFVAFSREALFGTPNDDAGYQVLLPDEPELRRLFQRDDEGPPYIFVANMGTRGIVRCHFEYFPTRKRSGSQPMPGAGNRDFPSIVEFGATITPGV